MLIRYDRLKWACQQSLESPPIQLPPATAGEEKLEASPAKSTNLQGTHLEKPSIPEIASIEVPDWMTALVLVPAPPVCLQMEVKVEPPVFESAFDPMQMDPQLELASHDRPPCKLALQTPAPTLSGPSLSELPESEARQHNCVHSEPAAMTSRCQSPLLDDPISEPPCHLRPLRTQRSHTTSSAEGKVRVSNSPSFPCADQTWCVARRQKMRSKLYRTTDRKRRIFPNSTRIASRSLPHLRQAKKARRPNALHTKASNHNQRYLRFVRFETLHARPLRSRLLQIGPSDSPLQSRLPSESPPRMFVLLPA